MSELEDLRQQKAQLEKVKMNQLVVLAILYFFPLIDAS